MKTALVFGSTGLVGSHLLDQLIKNENYNKIKLFVRSEIIINDLKVEIVKTDFNNMEKHKEEMTGDHCYFCIGTTKQNSPNKDEYRRVELDLPKQIAQITKSNSVNSFVFVSSGYADPWTTAIPLFSNNDWTKSVSDLISFPFGSFLLIKPLQLGKT